MYYELRVSTSKLPKDVFRNYDFESKKFMGRDISIISPKTEEKSDKDILFILAYAFINFVSFSFNLTEMVILYQLLISIIVLQCITNVNI